MKYTRYYYSGRMLVMSAAAAMTGASKLPTKAAAQYDSLFRNTCQSNSPHQSLSSLSPPSELVATSNKNTLTDHSTSSAANFVINRLSMKDISQAKNLFSRCFPLTATHSWGRALGLNRTLDGYMASYLPTPIQNSHLGCIAARCCCWVDENEQDNQQQQFVLEEEKGQHAASSKMEEQKQQLLVGALLLEFLTFPKQQQDQEEKEEENPNPMGSMPIQQEEQEQQQLDEATTFAYAAIDGIMNECKHIFHYKLQETHGHDSVKCGYVAWIAVDEHFRGTGIASSMIAKGNQLLKDAGCRYAVAFTVSPTATRVFQKQGYQRWGFVRYSDYELDGKRPFAILPDEVSVMVCDLDQVCPKVVQ